MNPFSSFRQQYLKNWLNNIKSLLEPDKIHICNGTKDESNILFNKMVNKNILRRIGRNSYLGFTHPSDTARVEKDTYISCFSKINAGPTNNWKHPDVLRNELYPYFKDCMNGKTMYVIPFMLGPEGNRYSCKYGIQVTDSEYVVENMKIMTKVGTNVIDLINDSHNLVVPCVHTTGNIEDKEYIDGSWSCSNKKYIAHFTDTNEIYSYGSGYGGNALLSKKCLALRIASKIGYKEGWLAEHMFILSITNPDGEKKYLLGAFPSSCGKTNMSMLESKLDGWKIKVIGDDIAWIRVHNGKLYAINPENGFFGVSEGTNSKTNPNMIKTLKENVIYTNCGYDIEDNEAWWKGCDGSNSSQLKLKDWKGNININLTKEALKRKQINHPNARFTVSKEQSPILDEEYDNPLGVPISGIIFGGRRSDTIPLITQAKSWTSGVAMGATLTSETTSASSDVTEKIRYDPFAMLPFCGYNITDYFNHWLSFGQKNIDLPKIFKINVFRKNNKGEYIWPGFSDNIYLLKWMFERIDNDVDYIEAPIGYLPKEFNCDKSIISYNKDEWSREIVRNKTYLSSLGDVEVLQKEMDNWL